MRQRRRTGTRQGTYSRWFLGAGIALATLPAHLPAAAQSVGGRVPELHGTTFSGEPVALPEVLRGKVGVLVIGFSQGSRDAVTAWGTKLAADYLESSAVLFYEIPVLASVPKLLRGFVLGRINAAVAERGKPHFIALTENEAAWRTLVHYEAPDDSYVLLVDGDGIVRWQMEGPATDTTYAALKHKIEDLQQRRGTSVGR